MRYLHKILFLLYFSLLVTGAMAQPGDPCPNPPFCDPDVPITGIEILLVAGAGLGFRKFLQHRKKSS